MQIAHIDKYYQWAGRLCGVISGHPKLPDTDKVGITSQIVRFDPPH